MLYQNTSNVFQKLIIAQNNSSEDRFEFKLRFSDLKRVRLEKREKKDGQKIIFKVFNSSQSLP